MLLDHPQDQAPPSFAHRPSGAEIGGARDQARRLVAMASRRRAQFGAGDAFGDPGWDILVFLFVMEELGRPVSVTDAISGADLPIGTGVRWVRQLGEMHLVRRERDPVDRRRSFVSLTDRARGMLVATLAE